MEKAHNFLNQKDGNKCSFDQYTINPNSSTCIYKGMPMLNKKGVLLLAKTFILVKEKVFKDTMIDWYIVYYRSGTNLSNGIWCSSDNVVICGTLEKSGKEVQTSPVRFLWNDWVLTCSGSLYHLPIEFKKK